jgi:hypothetical protein
MAIPRLDQLGTSNSSPGRTFKIHDLARAVRFFSLACPASKAKDSPGMFMRRMRQNRGERNWLTAGQAANTTIRLLNSFRVHIKRLLYVWPNEGSRIIPFGGAPVHTNSRLQIWPVRDSFWVV